MFGKPRPLPRASLTHPLGTQMEHHRGFYLSSVGVVLGDNHVLPGDHGQIQNGKNRQANIRIPQKDFLANLSETGNLQTAGVSRDNKEMT